MSDVLIIHDQAQLREALSEHLRRSGHAARSVAHLHQARRGPDADEYSVVLLGTRRGEPAGTAIGQVKAEWPRAEVVVLGESADLGAATEAVRHGAYEYIPSPTDLNALSIALSGAAATHRRRQGGFVHKSDDTALILRDQGMQALLAKADRAAIVNSTVLITGESGTGKEVLARRIHRHSARRHDKFVPVNCGSLPESLIETELFGYKKGAFTGAMSDSKGLIEEAENGVLFLDEIGEMTLAMQVRLLRFLDSGEIRPVGGRSVKHPDVRVIAATNRCLLTAIREKRFRDDLYFRLSVVTLHLPPLRERRLDIAPLVDFQRRRAATKLGLALPAISEEAMLLLEQYSWPGNVRELQNVMEQAVVQQVSGTITPADLPDALLHHAGERYARGETPGVTDAEYLTEVLRRHNGNHTATAATLGISRSTLWRRLRRGHATAPHGDRSFLPDTGSHALDIL
jgi:two-component system, NtrC family, response regulator AtoC